ncbi:MULTISPECIES: ribosome biogenesis factor YjgA [unclassified Oceanobacter]|uniref:ribosome biogenesis factor YjgA n=1 Tax=unclassified Oceanobacter TaxID=2620260 RepID=UPI0027345655|nr:MULTISPECIES: ribosome biogenesis factor YjgA [unclassified Oceanobacter]MDP2610118.1 ribosome biogenesis factor YjgA [Oceanobacter sp. 1_MG-2023]MDP2612307.1 ribosome biogenesis factor YjgA [Oceanobacter sp. 2_MG-2023]
MSDFDSQPDEEYELVSKSEMKREAERWQALGERLTELNPSLWNDMPISDVLHAALEESRRIKQHGAKRRHLQYIGRVMRDEDIVGIQEKIDLMDPSSDAYGRRQRQYEMWRTRLLQDNSGLNDFIDQYPQIDRQQLRNLVRNAQKEMAGDNAQPGKAYKSLFQFIKTETE